MAGKISEYILTTVKKATDLLDMTVLEGGVLLTRSITALDFFKPRTKTLPFAQPQITIDFGFETTATVNITGDTTIFIGTFDNGGVYQLILYPDATPRTVTLGSSFGDNLESSSMQFVTYPNRPYVIRVYVSHNGQVSHSVDRWQASPADVLAGTNEIVCKTQFGYFTRTLTAISAWIKSAIYASDVINNSTKVTGATVKTVFDNADCVAVTSLQDTDMIPFGRANGAVSENKMIHALEAKDYFASATSGAIFVATEQELTDALASENETIQICATVGITNGSISNVYAGNLWITGRKLIFNSGLIVPNSSSTRAVTRVFFDASVTMLGDVGEGACVFVVTNGIWHFTFRNLVQDMPLKFIVSAGAVLNVTTGNTITVDPASTGTYTVTQDSTLDLGQDDVRLDGSNVFNVGAGISANTEVLIKANTGFVTLATLGMLGGIIRSSERYSETAIVDATGGYGPFNFATVPSGYDVEAIDITVDVAGSANFVIRFEAETDVFSAITNSDSASIDVIKHICNDYWFNMFPPYQGQSQRFSNFARNMYGVSRRLQLGFTTTGNPAMFTLKTTFRRIP